MQDNGSLQYNNSLSAPFNGAAPSIRAFTNPKMRREIPAHLDYVYDTCDDSDKRLAVIAQGLSVYEVSFADITRINIVYPHKDPDLFPDAGLHAMAEAKKFMEDMQGIVENVEWVMADAIVDTVNLDRSNNQGSPHALTKGQTYAIRPDLQRQNFPFMHEGHRQEEYFVIVDSYIEQGTTIANLMNFVQENGGVVVAAFAHEKMTFRQKKPPAANCANLSGEFANAARNTARLDQVAHYLSKSAGEEGILISGQEAIEQFENVLNKNGNSVFALTDQECMRVVSSLMGMHFPKESYTSLMGKLGGDKTLIANDAAEIAKMNARNRVYGA